MEVLLIILWQCLVLRDPPTIAVWSLYWSAESIPLLLRDQLSSGCNGLFLWLYMCAHVYMTRKWLRKEQQLQWVETVWYGKMKFEVMKTLWVRGTSCWDTNCFHATTMHSECLSQSWYCGWRKKENGTWATVHCCVQLWGKGNFLSFAFYKSTEKEMGLCNPLLYF